MQPIREAYPLPAPDPDDDEEPREYFGDYQPLLNSFGYEILLQVDQQDYQGDSWLLFRDGDRIGLLVFGWGSCSGCDALQGCDSIKDVEELRDQLHSEIKWMTAPEALIYLACHDWEGDYSWEKEEAGQFVKDGKAVLESRLDVCPQEGELIAAVLADPSLAYLYADWLDEHGRSPESATLRATKHVKHEEDEG